MKIDVKVITQLNEIDNKLKESCSKFEEELKVYETIEVHAGCSGCFGTQMACTGPIG